MTDYDIATKLRLQALDLHEAILAARLRGLTVHWSHMNSHTDMFRQNIPGNIDFAIEHLEISRFTAL